MDHALSVMHANEQPSIHHDDGKNFESIVKNSTHYSCHFGQNVSVSGWTLLDVKFD